MVVADPFSWLQVQVRYDLTARVSVSSARRLRMTTYVLLVDNTHAVMYCITVQPTVTSNPALPATQLLLHLTTYTMLLLRHW